MPTASFEADVAVERRPVDAELLVAQRAAEELFDALAPEDGGVHLHDDVRVVLFEEVERDALDLVGRGQPWERGEGDAIERLAGDLDGRDPVAESSRESEARAESRRGRAWRRRWSHVADRVAPDAVERVAYGAPRAALKQRASAGSPREIGGDVDERPSPRRTRRAHSSSVSSCDHSTLKPTFCASMHGRGMSSRSSTWIVLSSRIRAPPSQARTMFCASCACGPAAGPRPVEARAP